MSNVKYIVIFEYKINILNQNYSLFKNKLNGQVGSRGQIPWIKLNDYSFEDSQLCIEYLSKVFNVDLNAHLTIEQKAIARSVSRMTDEALRWF